MTTMQATAVISAVDRASAVFRRVAATAQAVAGRFGALTTAAQRVGNAATGPGSFGAAIASGYFLRQQFEFEKALNRIQAILDITPEKFKPLREEIVRLA